MIRKVKSVRQCVMKNPAAGGGHWVDVAPDRFDGWVDRFAERHGAITDVNPSDDVITFVAADGAIAECHPPFPSDRGGGGGWVTAADDPRRAAATVTAHALRDRIVGVLLVRLGGYAVGVFAGSPPVLRTSKTGSRLVHGRSAAGGWSQHRFARRRDKQASEALAAAAQAAVGVL